MKKYSVTIGIPAFNEAANIGQLLTELTIQKTRNICIEKIIVVSDGSKDRTAEIAQSVHDPRITVLVRKARAGRATRQNEIISDARSDMLVILDADIVLKDTEFIEKLTAPLRERKGDFSASAIRELPPCGLVEKVLYISMRLKNNLFESWNEGNNMFTCHGPARAFTKDVYKRLRFTQSDGEDMYSYLYCVNEGFRFAYARDAVLWYRLPRALGDHWKQSLRYNRAQKKFSKEFDSAFVNKQVTIPISSYAKGIMKSFGLLFRYPIHSFLYLAVLVSVQIQLRMKRFQFDTWNVLSSKAVR